MRLHAVILEPTSYPVGLEPDAPGFTLHAAMRKTETRDVPMHAVARLHGRVSVQNNDYFDQRAPFSPSQLRILLMQHGAQVQETFTDHEGAYYFENLTPGEYEIALDLDWLPSRVTVLGADRHAVAGDAVFSAASYDFSLGLKKKSIITTFSE